MATTSVRAEKDSVLVEKGAKKGPPNSKMVANVFFIFPPIIL
jgi:hypothetical protein